MKMVFAVLAVVFSSSAFADAPTKSTIHFPEYQATYMAELYGECSHNGASQAGAYDPGTFSADKFKKELREKDGGCARIYSKSSVDAIQKFESHLSSKNPDPFTKHTQACVAESVPDYKSEELLKYMRSSDTQAVVANIYQQNNRSKTDSSESC
ncbi:MAG: hypothetical protein V4692_14570, partial [Bdellovibrionota bacterium]